MSRPRSGIGIELASVILILACLAGSMALVIAVHRREVARKSDRPAVAVAPPPAAPKAVKPTPAPVIDEPEPAPAPVPTPIDPTPGVLAVLTSHEAEQLLEASKADRRTAALEAARREAMLESERLRRRESLVHAQLGSLDTKVRKLESEADQLAFERDALLKERDARKAMAARSRSRPAQAILPHKGPNGTWRRPIVIECRDGMAILQPQGTGFGLMELEGSGFGPLSNPFTAIVAREAIRIQGKSTPDGKPVVPYIFFVVRPDGIRPYYEARGRLEALGITFGYELADQDWQIDFPDLDDTASWDGSAPYRPAGDDPMAANPPSPLPGSGRAREDDEFPAFATAKGAGGGGDGRGKPVGGPGGDFAWPAASPYLKGLDSGGIRGGVDRGTRLAPKASVGGGGDPLGGPADPGPIGVSPTGADGLGEGSGTLAGFGQGNPGRPGPSRSGDGRPDETLTGLAGGTEAAGSPGQRLAGRVASEGARLAGPTSVAPRPPGTGDGEPGSDFVWNGKNSAAGKPGRAGQDFPDRSASNPPEGSTGTPAFDPSATPGGPTSGEPEADPTQPGGSGSTDGGQSRPDSKTQAASGSTSTTNAGPKSDGAGKTPQRVIGPGSAPPTTMTPPPGMTGLAMGSPPPVLPSPGMPIPPLPDLNVGAPKPRPMATPEPPSPMIVDRTFEIVFVCGPRGVIVQPGGYRVTADALKDRDGLLKKQVVALIKARRVADPKVILEPRVRFLVQPGGSDTYRAAKGQFLLSGLDYPSTTQVADPDPLSILPSEGW